jgi:DNA invertase Pin-like site-specific DNA recombinase
MVNMTGILIGYARCSTDKQDIAMQHAALVSVGVDPSRIYTDHGLSGTNRLRPGLDQALAAVRSGDTLVVAKLDRLARSVPDARDIADALARRGVKLNLGGTIYDPADPLGKVFFNILATFAEFEVDLIRQRTREGMALARARGKLRGKKPKLSDRQQVELCRMYDSGDYAISDLADLFTVSRPTVYRTLARKQMSVSGGAPASYGRKPAGRPGAARLGREAQPFQHEAARVEDFTVKARKADDAIQTEGARLGRRLIESK